MKTAKASHYIIGIPTIILLFALFYCSYQSPENQADSRIQRIDSLKKKGYDITDLHAHLKGGLTIEQLVKHSRFTGIDYGVAVNCGVGFHIQNDSALSAYFHSIKEYDVFHGMQAEGREWTSIFSPDSIALFDYVFTDAMTFFDAQGRRTRLWINAEVFIDDADSFMEYYASQIEEILNNEPIDIYVNPTFLPDDIADSYDDLWTDERMQRVITALKENGIALEINARYKIPSADFIKKAKEFGVKFTMGTNNGGSDLGYLEYSLQMIEECSLEPDDFWLPTKRIK